MPSRPAVPPAPVTWRELTLHGHRVRYAEAGEDSGGPVVVLLHGIASRADQWEPVMAGLGHSCHVLAPDLPGHGGSAKPRGDYSLGAHACAVRDLLATLGHDRVTLVGHSLGGGIAMTFAYQFPERVARLALVCSGGLGREVTGWLRAATLPGSEWVLPVITARWVRVLGGRAHQLLTARAVPVPAGVVESLRSFGSLGDPATREAFVHTARSVMDLRGQRVDGRDRLYLAADLALLVVWGTRDPIIPVAHGRDLAARVDGARFEEFENSGHYPHLSEPDRLAALLADWVATTPAAHLDPQALTRLLKAAQTRPGDEAGWWAPPAVDAPREGGPSGV